jgi:pimeloyl-ACP methyl ester carboxylesterase
MKRPTIVLIPGAWHTPEYWGPVAKTLEAVGYKTRTVTLPSVKVSDVPPDDLRADIFAIREVVQEVLDEGSDAVVVPHSYGGLPTTGAIKGLDPKSRQATEKATAVVGIAGISTILLAEGNNILTGMELPFDSEPDVYAIDGEWNYVQEELNPGNMFYNGLPEKEVKDWLSKLRPMFRKAHWGQKSEYSAYKDIPTHYLICGDDQALSAAQQRQLVDKINKDGGNVRVEELPVGHSPMLVMPEETSNFIRRSAGETVPGGVHWGNHRET